MEEKTKNQKSMIASLMFPADKLFNSLSYTHFVQLLPIEDPLERTFFETECIKGVWNTRELIWQIDSAYFIRNGLSRDKKALQSLANQWAVRQSLNETVNGRMREILKNTKYNHPLGL